MDNGGYVQRLQPSAGNSRLETPLVHPPPPSLPPPCDSSHYSVSCKSRVFALVVEQELSRAQALDSESCGYVCFPLVHKHPNWREGKTARKVVHFLFLTSWSCCGFRDFRQQQGARKAPVPSVLPYVTRHKRQSGHVVHIFLGLRLDSDREPIQILYNTCGHRCGKQAKCVFTCTYYGLIYKYYIL